MILKLVEFPDRKLINQDSPCLLLLLLILLLILLLLLVIRHHVLLLLFYFAFCISICEAKERETLTEEISAEALVSSSIFSLSFLLFLLPLLLFLTLRLCRLLHCLAAEAVRAEPDL